MTSLIPAQHLDDAQLRQELVAMHQVGMALRDQCPPDQREVLDARVADLDAEYLRRFPHAKARWPWREPCSEPIGHPSK